MKDAWFNNYTVIEAAVGGWFEPPVELWFGVLGARWSFGYGWGTDRGGPGR